MMHCVFCKKGLKEGLALHRINAKGQPGIWACTKHVKLTDAPPPDAVTLAIVKAAGAK